AVQPAELTVWSPTVRTGHIRDTGRVPGGARALKSDRPRVGASGRDEKSRVQRLSFALVAPTAATALSTAGDPRRRCDGRKGRCDPVQGWRSSAASTSEVVARFLKLSVKKRAATLPSRPTTKTVGHATPVFSSATPKARIAVCLVSERSGYVRPSLVASSAESFGSSTETATS